MAKNPNFDVIIIGSGPGGSTVAKELALRGLRPLVLEWGDNAPLTGTFSNMAKIAGIPGKGLFIGRDASLLLRGITTGGSSTVNYATAIPPPAAMFETHGIDLSQEIIEVRNEIPVAPLPDALIGPMAKKIMHSAHSLGYTWQKLDKMIYTEKCRTHCWRCTYGCPFGAKWNARYFLDDAVAHGAQLITKAKAKKIIIQDHRAIGVEYICNGNTHQAFADKIIVSAGGLGTPKILAAAGIQNTGKNYFVDPVVAVMGSINGLDAGREVPMAAGLHLADDGIMLADMILPKPLFQAFALQVGRLDRIFSHANTLTIMVKAKDQLSGRMGRYWPNKKLSAEDKDKLNKGTKIATEILAHAGAFPHLSRQHFEHPELVGDAGAGDRPDCAEVWRKRSGQHHD